MSNGRTSVPSVSISVDQTNIAKGGGLDILRVVRPAWTSSEIKSKVFTDGLSNIIWGFFVPSNPEDMVIIKVFGSHTGSLIDRKAEIETMMILHDRKCGAELYATFDNGICYEFMNGSTLEVEDCAKPEVFPLVAAEMARMHSSLQNKNKNKTVLNENILSQDKNKKNGTTTTTSGMTTSPLWKKMRQFNKLAEESMQNDASLRERLSAVGVTPGWASGAISALHDLLTPARMPVTFCHNDLIPRNIVYNDKKKRVTFIDVEYAMPNYPAFDVANHFLEFAGVPELNYSKCPGKEFRLRWISEYLANLRLDWEGGKVITEEEFNHWVDLCTPASHLFWGLWAIHQARHSTIQFDYVQYVGKRFAEFTKCMKTLTEEKNEKI
ncbi:ethanolamine kinase 1 isoform X2 [Folsomia candida]|nr:ethanolamine kinase 1 isoform X2 [Folsomia candida]